MKKLLSLLLIIFLVGCSTIIKNNDFEIIGPITGNIGDVIKLDINKDEDVLWSSSNPEIASINDDGEVNPLLIGHSFITATLVADKSIQKMIVFTVTEKLEEPKGPSEPEIEDSDYLFFHTKILSIDEDKQEMELLNVPYTKYANNVKVNQKLDNINAIGFSSLNIGMENIYVAVNKNTEMIDSILVDGEIGFSNIRVAIRYKIDNIANDDDIYHSNITLIPNSAVQVQTFDGVDSFTASANQEIKISNINGQINITSLSQSIKTNKRIIINNPGIIQITTITRATSTKPAYSGNMEVSLEGSKLLLVNDVSLESYLTKVVPSEMPSSFHTEALKAQAVAARTYAYADIFNKSNIKFGYTVDDSVKSQVYNNQSSNNNTTNAVNNTRGMIMIYNNEPINAFYYSTSSGLTASGNEVWIDSRNLGEVIPYLIGRNLSKINGVSVSFDYQNEASMLEFYKKINLDTPDTNSLFHRWVTTMNSTQLKNTINANLKISHAANPNLVLTKVGDSWVNQAIPNDIGDVLNIYVAKRGSSGVVIELDIETTSGIYKIVNQYTIRFTIRPIHAGSTVETKRARNTDNKYTNTVNNISILYSGFFAIEKIANNYYFYGGGNGHGVGMSQYGASGLGNQGKSYREILETYYESIELKDISYSYQKSIDVINAFRELL